MISLDVAVRVSYCKNIDCASEFPAESRFVLLDPYTIGERTKATLNAATVPSGKGTPVEYKCSKGRCVPSGTGVSPVCGQSSPPEDAATPDVGDSGDAGDQTDF